MDWIKEIPPQKIESLLENDVAIIYQECGLDVLIPLWDKLAGVNLYISERSLFALKRFFVRHTAAEAAKAGAPLNVKRLAVKLGCSEQFIYESLAAADDKGDDPRQGKLI